MGAMGEPDVRGSTRLDPVRIAAMADLHYGRGADAVPPALLRQVDAAADVVLVCGDLTDHGSAEEARGLAQLLRAEIRAPVVAVLGNHDCESNMPGEVTAILRDNGVTVLDGDSCEIRGVGFAGTKGFCGGFGRYTLGAWGERAIKQFVEEAIGEALKLETALARVRAIPHVAVLHYSPVLETVEGEPAAIHAFLGSSRLEEPISRATPAAVFHGHAHHGRPEGRTARGVAVYNVSLPLLRRLRPDAPFHLLTLQPQSPPPRPADAAQA